MSTTPTHCPSCNSALGPFFCPVGYTAGGACSNPDCTDNTVHIGFSQPAQESQGESIPAPAEAGQVVAPTCGVCGSSDTEPCCHPPQFCQAICNSCRASLNADGSLWLESYAVDAALQKASPALSDFSCWLSEQDYVYQLRSGFASPAASEIRKVCAYILDFLVDWEAKRKEVQP